MLISKPFMLLLKNPPQRLVCDISLTNVIVNICASVNCRMGSVKKDIFEANADQHLLLTLNNIASLNFYTSCISYSTIVFVEVDGFFTSFAGILIISHRISSSII